MACSCHATPFKRYRLQTFASLFIPPNEVRLLLQGRDHRYFSSTRKLCDARPSSITTNDDANNHDKLSSSSKKSTNRRPDDTSKTRPLPSDLLPRSPLFELANTRAAGNRPRKPQGTKADDDRLRNNPWAMMLASPVRLCSVSSIRMPKLFLTDIGLIRRIDESQRTSLWWMPTELLKDELGKMEAATTSSSEESDMQEEHSASAPVPARKPPTVRLISRALLFEHLAMAKHSSAARDTNTSRVKPSILIPSQWRMPLSKSAQKELSTVDWPEGLSKLILKALGKKVVKALKEAYRYETIKKETADQWRVLSLPSDLSVPALLEALRQIQMTDMRTGAVVILGDPSDLETKDPLVSNFPDYLTLPQTKSTVPVFDLSTQLSAPHRQELRERIPRFGEKAFFFRPDGPKSVDAMLAMWELKGFTMHDTAFLEFNPTEDKENGST